MKNLQFYGGAPILLVPFGVMFIGILILGFSGMALPEAFWPMSILGLLLALLLSKNKSAFVDAMVKGISSNMLAIMLLAWFLAGIMGELLSNTGLVQGLVWVFLQLGISAVWFPLITFIMTSLISLSTGSAVGVLVSISPILFPVGYSLGADPFLVIGAIIGGSYVGDNIAPISDTTIVSAYSQGTTVNKVVKSRLKYALVASLLTFAAYLLFALFGSYESHNATENVGDFNPTGLVMLIVPVILIFLMLRGNHFVTALLYSLAVGFIVGLAFGLISFSDILSVDEEEFSAGGIVIDGINSMVGVSVFTIFLMAMIGAMQSGGLIEWLMKQTEKFATTPKRAEISIVFITLLVNALTTAGTPTMVMLGDFVRRLGHKFSIAPWRRGNLMDACSTTIIGLLPYSIGLLIPFSLVGDQVTGIDFSPISAIPFVFYCWALMLVIIFAAASGWGMDKMTDEEKKQEAFELQEENDEVAASNQ